MKKTQLFLIHFAGGNRYSFRPMEPFLNDFEVISLELPGRGRRAKEQLLKDFDLAARDLYDQLTARLDSQHFLIYGHSMGAYLALRVANMLERSGRPPAYLIVSGNAGPGLHSDKKRYLLTPDAFMKELELLGGISPEFKENEELFSFFEPILRADFEIAERNEMVNEPPVNVPLFAMMGSEEEKVEEISNWSSFTQASFNYEVLEGDHFFINKHPGRITDIIKACYAQLFNRCLTK